MSGAVATRAIIACATTLGVLMVLIASVILAVIALGVVWAVHEHDLKVIDAAMARRAEAARAKGPPAQQGSGRV